MDDGDTWIPAGSGRLSASIAGDGPPLIVLHGGPELDRRYLAPDLEGLTERFRVIAYDQRGRGRSAGGVVAADVTLAGDLRDLADVCAWTGDQPVVLLGHSWGALLGVEFALVHPDHVAALLLVDAAPMSLPQLRASRAAWFPDAAAADRDRAARRDPTFVAADPDAVAARYVEYYRGAVAEQAALARLGGRLAAALHAQGSAGIRLAREIESRLYDDSWRLPEYDRMPQVTGIRRPTLVLSGEDDPTRQTSEELAAAIPGARLRLLPGTGHFALLEATEAAIAEIVAFGA